MSHNQFDFTSTTHTVFLEYNYLQSTYEEAMTQVDDGSYSRTSAKKRQSWDNNPDFLVLSIFQYQCYQSSQDSLFPTLILISHKAGIGIHWSRGHSAVSG